jgi:hypothetical protein
MAIGSPVLYADFSGGVNKEAGPYLLQETECQDTLNVTSSQLGSLEKRKGLSTYSSLKNGSNAYVLNDSAHSLFAVNTTTKYLLAVGPHTTPGTDAIVAIAGTGQANAIKTNATANTRWEWVQAPTSVYNEQQTVTVLNATGGTFTLTYDGQTTAAINHNASATDVSTALINLNNIGSNDVSVTKDGTTYTVTFVGSLGGTNVPALTADGALLTGTSPTVTIATTVTGATQGPIFGVNGADPPQYWTAATGTTDLAEWTAVDGTGASYATHPARYCKYLIYHLDKVWAAGDPNNPGRIVSTGVSTGAVPLPDPRNWDTEDFTDEVDPYDGQQITGLGKIGPYLLVFKDRKTFVLTNPQDRAYRQISSTIGCIAHRSIAETSQGTFFLSDDVGVCVTDGSTVSVVSDKIKPLLDDAVANYALEIRNAAAVFYDDSYYLSIPYQDNKNSILLEYNLQTQSWWIHDCPVNQFAILDPSGIARLYGTDPATRLVSRYFVPDLFSDNGNPYLSYWQGPFWAWGQPHINKRINQLRIDGRGQWSTFISPTFGTTYADITPDAIPWEVQSDDTNTFAGSGNFAGTGDFAPQAGIGQYRYSTPTRGWGRAWSMFITDGVPSRTTQTQAELEGTEDLDAISTNDFEIYAISAFARTRTD